MGEHLPLVQQRTPCLVFGQQCASYLFGPTAIAVVLVWELGFLAQ
jgi:hypothetical protein